MSFWREFWREFRDTIKSAFNKERRNETRILLVTNEAPKFCLKYFGDVTRTYRGPLHPERDNPPQDLGSLHHPGRRPTCGADSTRYVQRLEGGNEFLRGQIQVKNGQIRELIEREHGVGVPAYPPGSSNRPRRVFANQPATLGFFERKLNPIANRIEQNQWDRSETDPLPLDATLPETAELRRTRLAAGH